MWMTFQSEGHPNGHHLGGQKRSSGPAGARRFPSPAVNSKQEVKQDPGRGRRCSNKGIKIRGAASLPKWSKPTSLQGFSLKVGKFSQAHFSKKKKKKSRNGVLMGCTCYISSKTNITCLLVKPCFTSNSKILISSDRIHTHKCVLPRLTDYVFL